MAEKPTYEELKQLVQELETDKTHLEKKLQEANFFSEEIMRYMTEGLVLTDVRETVIFINQRLSEMLGYLPEQIIGKCWLDMVSAEQQAIAQEALARRAQKHTDRYEIVLRHKDGHKFPVMIGAGPRFDKQSGEFIGTMGVVTDITDRKQAEDALNRKHTMLARTEAVAHVGSWEWEVEGDKVTWSEELFRILGLEPMEEAPPFSEHQAFYVPEDRVRLVEAVEECLRNSAPYDLEVRVTRTDRQLRHCVVRGIPEHGADGRVKRLYGSLHDITERKRTEATLRLQSLVLDQIEDRVTVTDLNGVITYVNNAEVRAFGYSRDELIGGTTDKYGEDPERGATQRQIVEETLEKGAWRGQVVNQTVAGKDVILDCRTRVVLDEQGNKIALAGISTDITDLKKMEAQLAQAQKMESVGRLAGGVAHDFNNMLGVISGRAELGLKKTALTDPVHKDFEQILNAAGRSADITRQLLAFARKQTIAPKVIDLNHTVANMLKMLGRLIGEDIDLLWQPDGDLWKVKMDPSQIDQILVNLCVNARDAIANVGKITIETGRKVFDTAYCDVHAGFVPGEFILLAVSDNGSGMDKDTLDNLFEPFFTTKETGRGTGLGLSTVYGIVKQNNGFINVYSEPEKGSSFRIYLPRHAADMAEKIPDRPMTPSPRGSGETILIVEDEATILEMLETMLESLNYTIFTAASPSRAMEMAHSHAGQIHLVITDVVMPEMNGRDLAEKLSALYPGINVLFMSGYTANVIAHQGVLDDGVAFIQKPFSMEDLAVKVREVLDGGKYD
ncbi:MAG: PAS domain S-box protein [Desulfotignum sp.]